MEVEESKVRLGLVVGRWLDIALSLNTTSSVLTSLKDTRWSCLNRVLLPVVEAFDGLLGILLGRRPHRGGIPLSPP